jgi:acetate kinase
MKILVLNSGSSSQKTFLYELRQPPPQDPPAPLWSGKIEWKDSKADLHIENSSGARVSESLSVGGRPQATEKLLDSLWTGPAAVVRSASEIDVVGHRIVNGGSEFREPAFVTAQVKAAIAHASVFAPLHNRIELDGIQFIEQKFGSVPQVAVFDTGFHRHLPDAAAVYPGPYEWLKEGIRRFGFHGINHQYCAGRAAQLLQKDLQSLRLITCHLGNGCSLSAIRDGHSIDTTMGFTPLEGLMMGTRSGSVDPGVLTYLMRHHHLTGEQLDDLLNKKSGLLGISGISGDMREVVVAMKGGNSRAKLAFDIFVHRLVACIGSMAASLGGVDALVFTAGIGENSPDTRAAACANLKFLGIELDKARNANVVPDAQISASGSAVPVLVIRAQEDWAIARECWRLMSSREKPGTKTN